jgi:hypothetical protein
VTEPELELVVCVGPAASVFGLDRDPRLDAGAPAAALLLQLLVVELLLDPEGVRGAVEVAAAREASHARAMDLARAGCCWRPRAAHDAGVLAVQCRPGAAAPGREASSDLDS